MDAYEFERKDLDRTKYDFRRGNFPFENKYFAEQFQKLLLLNYGDAFKLVGVSQLHLKEIKCLKNNYKVSVKLFNQFTSDLNRIPYHFGI